MRQWVTGRGWVAAWRLPVPGSQPAEVAYSLLLARPDGVAPEGF